jgi:hypothetical protein
VLDPQILLLYALKALRVGCAAFAIRVAGTWFQARYDRAVYGYGADARAGVPPTPLMFVGVALGIELCATLTILLLLLATRAVVGAGDDRFPVDTAFVRAWAVDVLATTLLVGVIAVIMASVVRNRVYFRYAYEGDRGVRALQTMVFVVYCIILVLPLYRLVFT